jgi:2-polyprenyl-6-methoxyphenol hydroxylase-like FAD-dependent oxidoreductase
MTGYDVVVVGGRVAGASTALLLARAGVRVAVVDRAARGVDTVSTHGLMRAGVLQLSRWGLLDRIVAAGTPPITRTLFHYGDGGETLVSIRPSLGVDALYAPRRTVLDRILVEAAEEAGAEVFHETVVTALLRDPDGRVCGVEVQDDLGQRRRLTSTLTVGADGIRSVVAQETGAAYLHRGRSASAVLYRYLQDLPSAGYEWAYGDGSAAGLLPTNDGATCVFVSTTPERMKRLRQHGRERAFTSLLTSAAPAFVDRVLGASSFAPMKGWGGIPAHVRQSWGPGWALVGDAGYYKDPITTHGMSDGLRDAELLADRVLDVLAGVPEHVALAAYQGIRWRLSTQLLEATEEVARYDWDCIRARELLRTVSSAMSDEVDHLQALPDWAPERWPDGRPDRLLGPGISAFIPTDNIHRAG